MQTQRAAHDIPKGCDMRLPDSRRINSVIARWVASRCLEDQTAVHSLESGNKD